VEQYSKKLIWVSGYSIRQSWFEDLRAPWDTNILNLMQTLAFLAYI